MKVIQTGKNKYAFRADVGKHPITGKRTQVYKSGFRSKKEAQLAKAAFINKIKTEGYFSLQNELMESLIDKWLNTVYIHEVQITTFERAKLVIKNHILPEFGTREVNSIKTYDIQQFLSSKTSSGLSPSSVKIIKNTLSKIFQTALDWDLIKANPMQRVKGPTIEKSEKEIWTSEEAKVFLEHCDQLRWKVAFNLALQTGMRRGEILALKWKNVNLDLRTVKVKESLAYVKGQGLIFTSPKTTNSIREIVISPSLVELLKELKNEQDEMKRRMGPLYGKYNLVISTADGKPVHPRNFARTFDRIITKAGVKKVSIHGLRHTNATLLMKQGINPKIVSERLGHANVGFTLDIYSHTDLEMQEESVNKLQNLLD